MLSRGLTQDSLPHLGRHFATRQWQQATRAKREQKDKVFGGRLAQRDKDLPSHHEQTDGDTRSTVQGDTFAVLSENSAANPPIR